MLRSYNFLTIFIIQFFTIIKSKHPLSVVITVLLVFYYHIGYIGKWLYKTFPKPSFWRSL